MSTVLIVPRLPRVLAVRQPHANRIASGEKPIEFRTWTTAYRGPLLIVASGTITSDESEIARGADELLPRSCAICIVDLVDVTRGRGRFDWHLENPRRVPQVSLKPRLNLGYLSDAERRACAFLRVA